MMEVMTNHISLSQPLIWEAADNCWCLQLISNVMRSTLVSDGALCLACFLQAVTRTTLQLYQCLESCLSAVNSGIWQSMPIQGEPWNQHSCLVFTTGARLARPTIQMYESSYQRIVAFIKQYFGDE